MRWVQSSGHTIVDNMETSKAFAVDAISWFREASPYIRAHRHRRVVLCLPDYLLTSASFATLAHDLTLLSHLGLRLVLCFGLRAQIDEVLADGVESRFVEGRRVTDDAALEAIIAAAGRTRTALEARLSMALPHTPMAGARLSVSSGNFITGQPFGIHHGVDFLHTGAVRDVQTEAIQCLLQAGHLVLLPPLGYSLTGEVFNLPAEEVATETAIALRADKLVFFVPGLPADAEGKPIRQTSAQGVEALGLRQDDADLGRTLSRAARACQRKVARVHLLDAADPSALLQELFTRDGSGTMITAEHWETVRSATISDVGGIIELITPLQESGALATRSREQLELDIERFVVSVRDDTVVACAALYVEGDIAEIACVATHPAYRGEGRADRLLLQLENLAVLAGCGQSVLLSTRAAHWFVERGYREVPPSALPDRRRACYDTARNSKVFMKRLGDGMPTR